MDTVLVFLGRCLMASMWLLLVGIFAAAAVVAAIVTFPLVLVLIAKFVWDVTEFVWSRT